MLNMYRAFIIFFLVVVLVLDLFVLYRTARDLRKDAQSFAHWKIWDGACCAWRERKWTEVAISEAAIATLIEIADLKNVGIISDEMFCQLMRDLGAGDG